jgi:hypothetical protein
VYTRSNATDLREAFYLTPPFEHAISPRCLIGLAYTVETIFDDSSTHLLCWRLSLLFPYGEQRFRYKCGENSPLPALSGKYRALSCHLRKQLSKRWTIRTSISSRLTSQVDLLDDP